MTKSDATSFDLGQARLRLKDGLTFSVQKGKKSTWYLLEDDARSQFFRLGPAEYTFVSMLDGETTMATAMATTCSLLGGGALSEHDAINLCKWLVDTGLAHTKASTSSDRINERQERQAASARVQKLNPISIRFPLIELDGIAESVSRYTNWLVSWPLAWLWVFTCLFGLVCVLSSWDRLGQINFFSSASVIWMVVTWCLLKVIHEAAHVLSCKRFGGKVGKAGILLLLLIPMPYVDVTSSWKFPNKYQRIMTAAAGMLAEMFLAAIAAILWSIAPPGALRFHAANVMIAASLHTLLFNANPLMRFDGYHMLADWLEIPNLGNHGNAYMMGLGRRWFFGKESKPPEYAGLQGQVIKAYGVAAFLWKILICLTLGISAANMFYGIGLMIALFGVVLWVALPVQKLVKYLVFGSDFETPNRVRFLVVSLSIVAVVFLIGRFVPAPSIMSEPVVIDYKPLTVVRAETAGFVERIEVGESDEVDTGDLLMVLRNDDLVAQHAKTVSEMKKSRLRLASLQNQGEIGAWQAEQATLSALEEQLSEIQASLSQLEVRAPAAGSVLSRRLLSELGKYVKPGTELLAIGSPERKEAIALISQRNTRHLSAVKDQRVRLSVWGRRGGAEGRIASTDPRAIDNIPHFAFAGMYGGALDVVSRNQVEGESDDELMLTSPRVQVHIELDEHASRSLMAGQTGLVYVRGRSETLGQFVLNNSQRWFQERILKTHGF